MSETPRTDAVAWNGRNGECVWSGEMRKLELDYNALQGRVKELERDARRWRYARDHLRIGQMQYDSFGGCNCEFNDLGESFIDAHLPEHGA